MNHTTNKSLESAGCFPDRLTDFNRSRAAAPASDPPVGARDKHLLENSEAILRRKVGGILAAIMAVCGIQGAQAMTPKDMQIIARALNFLDPQPTGTLTVGVVQDAASPAAVDAAIAAFGGQVVIGGLTIVPKPVTMADAGGYRVLLLTRADKQGEQLAKSSAGKQQIVVSTESGCVEAKLCTLYVQSEPNVEIVLGRDVAAAAGVRFGAAFRMMIKER